MKTLYVFVLSSCCVTVGSVRSQRDSDMARCIGIDVPAPSMVAGGPGGTMRFLRNVAGTSLASAEWVDAGGVVQATVALPFHDVGAVLMPRKLATSGLGYIVTGREYAASGSSTLQGHILRMTASVSSQGVAQLAVEETRSTGQFDITKLALSERDRYFLAMDYGSRRLLVADLSAAQLPSVLPAAGDWQVVADSGSIAMLGPKNSATSVQMRVVGRGDVAVMFPCADISGAKVVHRTATGWSIQDAPVSGDFFIQKRDLANGLEPLSIFVNASVPSGCSWSLAGPSGVIATGPVVPGATNTLGMFPQLHLSPGERYSIAVSGIDGEVYFMPSVRYLEPGSTTSAFTVERVLCNPRLQAGGDSFSHVGLSTTASGAVLGFLTANVRGVGGVDPITWVGPTPVLDALAAVSFVFDPATVRNGVGRTFPVPAGMDGAVVLFQYVFFLPGEHVAVSEVFGGLVVGGSNTAMMSSGSGPSMGSGAQSVSSLAGGAVAFEQMRAALVGSNSVENCQQLRSRILSRFGTRAGSR